MRSLLPTVLAPAVLVALTAAGSLSADGTALAGAAPLGVVALLGTALLAAPRWRDPLGLGRRGALLPWALLAGLAASAWASEVPRAGLVPLTLAPACLLLPTAVARCRRGAAWARLGLPALSAAVLGLAAWALVEQAHGGLPRASLPLGHHGLLAAWLVTLLPLAALPALGGGWRRWLGAAAALAGLGALAASGSLLGILAVGAQLAALGMLGLLGGRSRQPAALGKILLPGALLALLALGAVLWPRLGGLARFEDPSLQARLTYWRAGLDAIAARPALGHGPGSTPWTLAEHLRPGPGVNPPGELVGHLHSLPLQAASEGGLPVLLLGLAVLGLFGWRRLRPGPDPECLAGLLGVAGWAVTALGEAYQPGLQQVVAVGVAAGAALPPGETEAVEDGGGSRPSLRGALLVTAYALAACALLWKPFQAERHYELAATALVPTLARVEIARAAAADPGFPLYAARLAWIDGDADAALRAAQGAPGVAALWLGAGALGAAEARPWALDALERACRTDPLSPAAPWLALKADPEAPEAAARAARALLAEPRLAAARFWHGRSGLLAEAAERVRRERGVDEGWREAFAAAARERLAALQAGTGQVPHGEAGEALVLEVDAEPATAFSWFLFRRRPWPQELLAIPLDPLSERLEGLPSPARLPTTDPAVLAPATCLGGTGRDPPGAG